MRARSLGELMCVPSSLTPSIPTHRAPGIHPGDGCGQTLPGCDPRGGARSDRSPQVAVSRLVAGPAWRTRPCSGTSAWSRSPRSFIRSPDIRSVSGFMDSELRPGRLERISGTGRTTDDHRSSTGSTLHGSLGGSESDLSLTGVAATRGGMGESRGWGELPHPPR